MQKKVNEKEKNALIKFKRSTRTEFYVKRKKVDLNRKGLEL